MVLKSVLKQDLAYRERKKERAGDRDGREIIWEQISVEKARGEEVMLQNDIEENRVEPPSSLLNPP